MAKSDQKYLHNPPCLWPLSAQTCFLAVNQSDDLVARICLIEVNSNEGNWHRLCEKSNFCQVVEICSGKLVHLATIVGCADWKSAYLSGFVSIHPI